VQHALVELFRRAFADRAVHPEAFSGGFLAKRKPEF